MRRAKHRGNTGKKKNHYRPRRYKREMAKRRIFIHQVNNEENTCKDEAVAVAANTTEEHNAMQQPELINDHSCNGSTLSKEDAITILDNDFYTLADLIKMGDLEIRFLVETLFPEQCLIFLAGESDCGKSTFCSQLALSIVSGAEYFLGFKINVKHKRVIIISTEDSYPAIFNKINLQMQKNNLSLEDTERLIISTTSVSIIEKLTKVLKSFPVALIIIDSFADVYDGDINTVNKVRDYLKDYDELKKKYNCTILFVHHIGKSREGKGIHKNQLLGSVGIEGKARQVLMMSKLNKLFSERVISIIKGNYVSEEDKKKSLLLSFDHDTRTFEKADGNFTLPEVSKKKGRQVDMKLVEEALKLKNEGKRLEEIGKILGKNKSTISRWFKNLKYPYDFENVDSDDDDAEDDD